MTFRSAGRLISRLISRLTQKENLWHKILPRPARGKTMVPPRTGNQDDIWHLNHGNAPLIRNDRLLYK